MGCESERQDARIVCHGHDVLGRNIVRGSGSSVDDDVRITQAVGEQNATGGHSIDLHTVSQSAKRKQGGTSWKCPRADRNHGRLGTERGEYDS